MAAALIIGGCGTVSHSLQFIPRIDTFRCNDCSNVLLTTSGFYYCSDCYHKTCTNCATHLSLFYPTLTDAQVAAIAAQLEEDEKTLIPCGGSSTHELKLLKQSPYDVFDKHFCCNVCWQEGDGELYHCDDCQFDAHRECAELPKRLKVFYHAHQLERASAYPGVSCDFCTKPVEEDFYMCELCNFTVHPMCAKHPQKLMHVAHNHILTLVPTPQEKSIICDGCITPAPGFRYTCQPCDFDLHPSCAIVPPNPLCIVDGGHRLAIDWKQGNFQCARCQQPGFSWSYHCEVHEVHLHLHCANEPLVEEEVDDDEDVADVWNQLYQAALVEAVNEDYAAKVNLLSQLLDVFMKTEVQTESSDNNQRSPSPSTSHQQQQGATTSTASAKVNTRAESETHVVTEMLGKMHVGGEDAEAKRKATKLAAKEAKQKEKAKLKVEQDAKIESMMKLLQELHRSRDNRSMSQADAKVLGEKIDIIQEKIGKLHDKTDTLHKKTDKLHDVSHEIKTTQVHLRQRRVPRIVLCTERGVNMKQKLLTKLPIGIRAVQLHLLCEQPGKEHIVADATGCEINQMIGERWNKLQPLLATGLQLVSMAVNVGGSIAGLGQIFPNLGRNVWDIKAVDLGNHSVQGRKTQGEQAVADALRVAQEEEESAAQWLVSYLEKNEVAIHEAFGLLRVRYIRNNHPAYSRGSLAWLCREHQSQGLQAGILESFPVRR